MTSPDPGADARLDARLRAAADQPFDDIAMTEAVLARVHAARRAAPVRRSGGWKAWLAPVAFALVLVATPVLVARLPLAGPGQDALLIGLATGDPRVLVGDADLGGILE